MSAAVRARYADPAEREKTSRAVKRGFRAVGYNNIGRNNPMFGRVMSEATKDKIRAKIAERGGVSGRRNPNYRHGEYC